jgi:prevent-host-death family protein
MPTVNMLEAKTQLSKLVEQVASGETREVIIARNGKPAARLVPLDQPKTKIKLGIAKGIYPPFDYDAFQALDADVARLFGVGEPKR